MTEDIRDWLNAQPIWLQEAATRILNEGAISDADLGDLVALVK